MCPLTTVAFMSVVKEECKFHVLLSKSLLSSVQPSSPDSVELESVEGDDVDASCRPQLDAQKGYQSKASATH